MSGPAATPPTWPPGTLDAAALAIHQIRTIHGHTHLPGHICHHVSVMDEDMAAAALTAAEAVWPHQPPKRDPASTTNAVLERAPRPPFRRRSGSAPAPFGFSRPDHYLGGASADEGVRDERWRDAAS